MHRSLAERRWPAAGHAEPEESRRRLFFDTRLKMWASLPSFSPVTATFRQNTREHK